MLRVLSLLLPALIPSWRFFKSVEPSPRVQWAVVGGPWQTYHGRPDRVGFWSMARRLVWNPQWNETLYMVSLAERLTVTPDAATLAEIWMRVGHEARLSGSATDSDIQFRLIFVTAVHADITYVSDPRPLSEITT